MSKDSDSEVFNNYIKIAKEAGIISDKDKPLKKKASAQSDKVSYLETLYGIKVDNDKSMEYKNNIMEIAHPNSVIIAPSYDKLNGLVENNIERQRIMLNIVNKPVNGHLTQKKYAESELIHSLVRVGNDMDNKDIEELRVLADICAKQLKVEADFDWSHPMDSAKKWLEEKGEDVADVGGAAITGAEIGAVIGGIVGAFGGPAGVWAGVQAGAGIGALASGLIASVSKTGPQAKSVAINSQLAINEIDDLIEKLPNDKSLSSLKISLTNLKNIAEEYSKLVANMHSSDSSSIDKQNAQNLTSQYLIQLKNVLNLIKAFFTSAAAGQYLREQNPYWVKIKSVFESVFGEDIGDSKGALGALKRVIETAMKDVEKTQEEAKNLKSKVPTQEEQLANQQKTTSTQPNTPTTTTAPSTTAPVPTATQNPVPAKIVEPEEGISLKD